MTFLEAAIAILRQAGRPLHVHELTDRSIKSNLLSHLGRAPEATMRTRLAQEAKKAGSGLIMKGQDIFGLRQYPAQQAAAPAPAAEEAAATPEGEEKKRRRGRRGGRNRKRPGEAATAQGGVEAGTPEEALAAEQLAEEGAAEAAAAEAAEAEASEAPVAPPTEPHSIDLDALQPVQPRRYPRVIDLPEDEVLSAQYADEVAAAGGVMAEVPGEMVDEKTADEDRPMLAEIKDARDRRGRGKVRGKDRGPKKEAAPRAEQGPPQRGERGGRGRRGERGARPTPPPPPTHPRSHANANANANAHVPEHAHAHAHAPEQTHAPAPAHPHPHPHAPPPEPAPRAPGEDTGSHAAAPPALAGQHGAPSGLTPEGSLADIALHLLRSLNDPRPVHARQLAAMALKRKLLSGDPEEVWRAIRSALAGDARARQAQGLRIRARHQGGGLFTLTTARLEDEVRAAEDALATVWRDVSRATREALRRRCTRLSLGALEQLARIYLDHTGVTAVERVKRVNETQYLSGSGKRGARPMKLLIAVRAGGGEMSRHAVGELRAGVQAKQLQEGLLLAPARLDLDGMRELEAAGPPIAAFSGEAFAEELERRGVGVVRTNLPVAYLDIDLLAELSEG